MTLELNRDSDPRELVGRAQDRAQSLFVVAGPLEQKLAVLVVAGGYGRVLRLIVEAESLDLYNIRALTGILLELFRWKSELSIVELSALRIVVFAVHALAIGPRADWPLKQVCSVILVAISYAPVLLFLQHILRAVHATAIHPV